MSARDLIAELRNLDVRLWVEEGKLRYSAPENIMTEALINRLVEHKQAVIEWLNHAIDSGRQLEAPILPATREYPIPASFAQERLLFLASLMPESDSYNVPLQLKLTGELDQTALQQSLNQIVARHESLRTTFESENGQHVQVIKPVLEVPLAHVSMVQHDPDTRYLKLQELTVNERLIPFNLMTGPLIRATLIQICSNEYALLVTLHHIVCDGWSLGILFKELKSFYQTFSSGSTVDSLQPAIQYADFSVWQREFLSGDTLDRQLSYWQKKLEGHTTLQLPIDFPRPQVQAFEGGQIVSTLPGSLVSGIKSLSNHKDATMFMTMLASFNVLLYRYCHQDDIVIGTPIANRNHFEIEDLIGFFVNMLVIRTDMSGSPTFDTLLKRVKENALEAYQYQDLPFEKLVEHLNTERDLSRNPIFQVSFALQNAPMDEVELEGLRIQPLQVDEASTTRFDLEVNIMENEGQLVIVCIFNTKLFRKKTIENMLAHYQEILKNIIADPNQSVDTLQMLTHEEFQKIVYQWNQTQYPKTHQLLVHQSVEKVAFEHPAQLAVISNNHAVDYFSINQSANKLAHYLMTLGASATSPITVLMERTSEMVVALLAILKTGSHYVPVDPEYPDQRLAFILEDTKSNIVITQSVLASRLQHYSGHVINLDNLSEKLNSSSNENLDISIAADQTAYVIYTSGSTGQPKGVVIPHSGLTNLVAWHQREYQPGLDDHASHLAGLGFDASVWELWPYLSAGSTIHLVPDELRLCAAELWQWIVDQGISLSFMPTPLAEAVLAEITPDSLLTSSLSLRALLTGGDKLHGSISSQKLPFRVINHYGPTENSVVTSYVEIDVLDEKEPAIGRPIDNVQVYILDKSFQVVPTGVTGKLFIGGSSLSRGYLNQPQLNAEKFIKNPFADTPGEYLYDTGDLARYRDNGLIEFSGRSDSQVKIRGFRIELGEVENVLSALPGIAAAAVSITGDDSPHTSNGTSESKQLIAYVVLNKSVDCNERELIDALEKKLPAYMVPSSFLFLDQLPLSANGKLDRNALPQPIGKASLESKQQLSDSKLENALVLIWCDLLGLEEVSTRDNFFDLGGHSLLLGKLHARLKSELNVDIKIVDLFRYTTIQSLANHILVRDNIPTKTSTLNQQKSRRHKPITNDEIAVVGMSGRFPGAENIDSFWDNLVEGVESIRFFTEEELIDAGVPEALINHQDFVPARGFLNDAEFFDADFFGYSAIEAELIDPQQRIFLESAVHALEHAGCDPQTYQGLIGVFAGTSKNTYLENIRNTSEISATSPIQVHINSEKDFVATRASYKLNLKGPGMTIQTACSTSLVAIHEACRSLQSFDSDVALAGGVSVSFPRVSGYLYQQGSILSSDGHCRTFDKNSSGTVTGEGVGVVVLKRLKDALADRDTIHAVVKGSAINNDGYEKAGFTAPGIEGQVNVIKMAQAAAGVSANTIGYVETHGTATTLGDPIEVSALSQAFKDNESESVTHKGCVLGSVKQNIGHLDSAAGVASFIKAVLSLEHGRVPPSPHFTGPNPQIDFEHGPFSVNSSAVEWPTSMTHPIRAGVSSFGIGGTNAHVILEQAPASLEELNSDQPQSNSTQQIVILSAKTATALQTKMTQLADYISLNHKVSFNDIVHTLQTGRSQYDHRCLMVASSKDSVSNSLKTNDSVKVSIKKGNLNDQNITFMFTGQGAQYPNMAKDLYLQYELFRNSVEECCQILQPHLGLNLLDILYAIPEKIDHAVEQLTQTQYAQCSLFVVEYAMAQLWQAWGVKPAAMIGHSIGEYTAACLAGVFSLKDALKLVANRGRLMQAQPAGSMLSVSLAAAELKPLIPDTLSTKVSIATINTPDMCVVSAEEQDVDALKNILENLQVGVSLLHTSHAFHSPMMDAVLEPFKQQFSGITLHAPEIPFISNLTGDWITPEQATDPEYWSQHLRNTVQFSQGVNTLLKDSYNVFIEMGPGNTLTNFIRQHINVTDDAVLTSVSSIRHPRQNICDNVFVLQALGDLWLSGFSCDWEKINPVKNARHIPLPVYPFEKKYYSIKPVAQTVEPLLAVENTQKIADINQWFYMPVWQRQLTQSDINPLLLSQKDVEALNYLVFVDDTGMGTQLVDQLTRSGHQVIQVTLGTACERHCQYQLTISPDETGISLLIDNLQQTFSTIHYVIYMWPLQNERIGDDEYILNLSFYFPLQLCQALNPYQEKTLGQEGVDPIKLWFVSDSVQQVTGDEVLIPLKSTLLGLNLVCSQEMAGLQTYSIDFSDVKSRSLVKKKQSKAVQMLLAEILKPSEKNKALNREIAYRGDYRWVKSFEAIEDQNSLKYERSDLTSHNALLKQQGVYLITGGFGGIGRILAEHLSEHFNARLILLGRTELIGQESWDEWLAVHEEDDAMSNKIQFIRSLENKGAKVMVASSDVSDAVAMKQIIELASDKMGEINGVIHTAGLPAGGLIQLKTKQSAVEILSAKVLGGEVLDQLFNTDQLDFMLLCSSLSAIIAPIGQVDYTAANIYLDTLAKERQRRGLFTVSINWDEWLETGMALDYKSDQGNEMHDRPGLLNNEGIEIFLRALEQRYSQVIISSSNLDVRLRPLLFSHCVPSTDQSSEIDDENKYDRPQLTSSMVKAETPTQIQLADIWKGLFKLNDIGMHDNFFELGGHSLLAVQAVALIRESFDISLSIDTFLDLGTIEKLASHIDAMVWAGSDMTDQLVDDDSRNEFEL